MKSPKIEKLLQNKYVLYVVSFIAIMNLLGYIIMKNINAAIFFSVVGFLSSYFTKNMIIIMIIAMVSTNLYVLGNTNVREAMSNRRKEAKEKIENKASDVQSNSSSNSTNNSDSTNSNNNSTTSEPSANSEPMTGLRKSKSTTNKIDYAKTLTDAYQNLESHLGADGIEGLTNQTKELMSQQNALMDNIKTIEPFLKTAQGFMKGLDMEGLTGLGNMVNNTLGIKKKE